MSIIGCIGVGSMGNPVAQRLAREGHHLLVHDLRREAAESLLDAGATWSSSPAEIAGQADAVFLSLPSHREVAEVCFGDRGVFSTAGPGMFLIDLTTVSASLPPLIEQRARERKVRYLTAPVSQGVENARLGRLSIFVGGDPHDHQDCLPWLSCLAAKVIYTGDHRSAIAAKLVTNYLWFVHATAIGEAMILGARTGLELTTLQAAVTNSCGTSWVAEHDLPSILNGTYDPSFTTALCLKDLDLIDELAAMVQVPLALHPPARNAFAAAADLYGPDSPELSLVRVLEEATGVSLTLPSD